MDLKENYDRLKKLRSLHSDVAKMIAFEEKCIREKKRKKAKSDKEKLHTISETNSISGHQPTTTNQDMITEDLVTSAVLIPVNPDAAVENANVQSTIVIKEEPTITVEPQTASVDPDTVTVNANAQSTIVIKEEPTITVEPQTASVDPDTVTVNANEQSTIVIKEKPTITIKPQTTSASVSIDRPKRSAKKINYRDKLNLAFSLTKLPRIKLGHVVRILRNREISVRKLDPNNIEIDLQQLKTSTLRELIRYVDMC